ncbi:thioredoxin domain-containing protein, partial [bacterium]|nr:thioredoxin domain-containing protein [bacterium]
MNKKANKLIDETSTYLLQHAHNPVEWYPWSQEALDASRAQEKPILLSIGYSACHWCHVMEHESFEDEETAALMNKLFINIKVDREERQDLDEIYMRAVQVMTGHGGWPMTVFLTPDLKPFFAGTYFPPENKHGMPSFKRVMLGVAQAWQDQRADILESASE